jgi:hypothetical protein
MDIDKNSDTSNFIINSDTSNFIFQNTSTTSWNTVTPKKEEHILLNSDFIKNFPPPPAQLKKSEYSDKEPPATKSDKKRKRKGDRPDYKKRKRNQHTKPDKMEYEDTVAQTPYDLRKCDISQLQLLCKENNILQTGEEKGVLIGKLLHLFPNTKVTEKDLHRFPVDELRLISEGLNISREGDTVEELAKRILKYHHTVLVHYKSPKVKKEKLNKLITERFHRIAPAIPVTVCDKLYKAEPYKSTSDKETYSWRSKETQEILIGNTPYNATVEFTINLDKITNQKDSSRD